MVSGERTRLDILGEWDIRGRGRGIRTIADIRRIEATRGGRRWGRCRLWWRSRRMCMRTGGEGAGGGVGAGVCRGIKGGPGIWWRVGETGSQSTRDACMRGWDGKHWVVGEGGHHRDEISAAAHGLKMRRTGRLDEWMTRALFLFYLHIYYTPMGDHGMNNGQTINKTEEHTQWNGEWVMNPPMGPRCLEHNGLEGCENKYASSREEGNLVMLGMVFWVFTMSPVSRTLGSIQ